MIAVIQRVKGASVTVEEKIVGKCGTGYAVLLGVAVGDTEKDAFTDALGHKYTDGVCKRCGETDPNHKEPITNPFTDVADTDWYAAPVIWAVENGITGGTSPVSFGPNDNCTRAQVVTFLYANAGKPPIN